MKCYCRLVELVKKLTKNYVPDKAPIFTEDELTTILKALGNEEKELAEKVMVLFAYMGLMRASELIPDLQFGSVVVYDTHVMVTIEASKTRAEPFSFVLLKNEDADLDPVSLVRSYIALCKKPTGRFFKNWHVSGQYIQNMGPSMLQTLPKKCAHLAGYDDTQAEKFTFHGFRRSAATALVNKNVDVTQLKRAGRWRSNGAAEGYVENSMPAKVASAFLQQLPKKLGF